MTDEVKHPDAKIDQLRQQLEICETRWLDIMSASPHGILIASPVGAILYANSAASDTLGCRVGGNLAECLDLAAVPHLPTEARPTTVDGRTITVEIWKIATEWEGEQAWFIAFHDVTERKRNDQELRKLSRAVLDSPSIVIITDADGTIEFVNPKFTAVTGYTSDEVVGRNPRILKSDRMPPELYRDLWRTITSGREWRGEMINRKKNGEYYWEFAAIAPITDKSGKITNFVAVTEEITERKRMEGSIRESEERFRATFDQAAVGIAHVAPDGRLLRVNRKLCDILCHTEEEMISLSVAEITHPDDVAASMEQFILLQEGKLTDYTLEKRYLRKDGSPVWVNITVSAVSDDTGKLRFSMGVVEDITVRKRAEESLRYSEARFQTLYRDNPTMIVTLDADLFMLDVNPACAAQLGFTIGELEGESVLSLFHEDDRPLVAVQLKDCLKSPHEAHRWQFRKVHRNGNVLWVEETAQAVYDLKGNINILVVCQDITERKRSEEAIKALNHQLKERAAELESANRELEAFNYTIAHDLRKPLTNINGYCQIIRDFCFRNLDDQCRDYLDEIYEGTLGMNQLIDTLLDFSRLAAVELHRERVDLSALAHQVAADLKLSAPGRTATFRIAEGVSVEGDAKLLRIVLVNLLGNAWKYTGQREDALIEFGQNTATGGTECYVRDNGSGFAMENAEKLFLPFHRLHCDEEFAGFGVGLATVERIIRRHGGTIHAEGEPGRGAIFRFTLPE